MNDEEIVETIKRAMEARRGYADGRSWPIDRDVEEHGIAQDFIAAAANEPGAPFSQLKLRGRGEDPPDCEARDAKGTRVAIELTELMNREAVERAAKLKKASVPPSAMPMPVEWTCPEIIALIQQRLAKKDFRERLKDGPYDEYIVVIYTAEQRLDSGTVRTCVQDHRFTVTSGIDRAYVSLDYEPGVGYPLLRLRCGSDPQR
jgi:hypothetical protein